MLEVRFSYGFEFWSAHFHFSWCGVCRPINWWMMCLSVIVKNAKRSVSLSVLFKRSAQMFILIAFALKWEVLAPFFNILCAYCCYPTFMQNLMCFFFVFPGISARCQTHRRRCLRIDVINFQDVESSSGWIGCGNSVSLCKLFKNLCVR